MLVARDRSRLVKLILPIASTIGRASNWVMSICSTGVASSSCLRVSLILDSEFISCSNSSPPALGDGQGWVFPWSILGPAIGRRSCIGGTGPPPTPPASGRGVILQLYYVRARGCARAVEARHGLVLDDRRIDDAEAVELRPHRAAVSAEHANFDVIARADISRKLERSGHSVKVVAGRAVEAELYRPRVRLLVTDEPYRVAPVDMGSVEQRTIGAVVDVQFLATTLFHADEDARIFGAQGAPRLAPKLRRIADRQRFEGLVDDREVGRQRRRLHPGIAGRKPSADIDDIDRNRGIDDCLANQRHRLGEGSRR